jgi:hypothetical protein
MQPYTYARTLLRLFRGVQGKSCAAQSIHAPPLPFFYASSFSCTFHFPFHRVSSTFFTRRYDAPKSHADPGDVPTRSELASAPSTARRRTEARHVLSIIAPGSAARHENGWPGAPVPWAVSVSPRRVSSLRNINTCPGRYDIHAGVCQCNAMRR